MVVLITANYNLLHASVRILHGKRVIERKSWPSRDVSGDRASSVADPSPFYLRATSSLCREARVPPPLRGSSFQRAKLVVGTDRSRITNIADGSQRRQNTHPPISRPVDYSNAVTGVDLSTYLPSPTCSRPPNYKIPAPFRKKTFREIRSVATV